MFQVAAHFFLCVQIIQARYFWHNKSTSGKAYTFAQLKVKWSVIGMIRYIYIQLQELTAQLKSDMIKARGLTLDRITCWAS